MGPRWLTKHRRSLDNSLPLPLPDENRYLVRDITDGTAEMSFVSEAMGDFNRGTVQNVNDHFEHLTCFVGGMLLLGEPADCFF